MSGGVYGGDEVGAIVIDIGHGSIRAGFAGEDQPKADIPSMIGVMNTKSDIQDGHEEKKYFIDTTSIAPARKDLELTSFLNDGMIEDWDLFDKMLEYIYDKHIHSDSQLHPILISEAPWNIRAKREKITELMFEKYKVPAFFLVKNAMLAAFANGRSTGLVLDSGASHTSAVPVQDGYVLQQAIVRQPFGGDYITQLCRQYFEHKGVEIVPPQFIASKEVVKRMDTPKWTKKKNIPQVTKSWNDYAIKKVLQDYQSSILQVSTDAAYEKEIAEAYPSVHYEFPNGYNFESSYERFLIPEKLFNPHETGEGVPDTSDMMDMAQLVTTSVGMCDIDLRPALYGTVIVTGGNTLITGFTDRLQLDLSSRTPPSMRLKLIHSSASQPVERRFGAWIGGSILASLGTFQQMWISKQEYEEVGKSQVDRKCP